MLAATMLQELVALLQQKFEQNSAAWELYSLQTHPEQTKDPGKDNLERYRLAHVFHIGYESG